MTLILILSPNPKQGKAEEEEEEEEEETAYDPNNAADQKLAQKDAAENSKLVKTLEGFKMMNQREPTPSELRKMKLFLSVPNDLVDDEDAMNTELATFKTGGGASWSVYYDETSGSLENAVKSFVQFHQRQPSNSEVQQIRSFLSLPDTEKIEEDNMEFV